MIRLGKRLILPPRVPGSLFGPFRSKRLPTFFTKAEEPTPPPEPSTPKENPPKPPTDARAAADEDWAEFRNTRRPPAEPTPPEALQESLPGTAPPTEPPFNEDEWRESWHDAGAPPPEPTGFDRFNPHYDPNAQEYPADLRLADGSTYRLWIGSDGQVLRVEGNAISIEQAQAEVERIEEENRVGDEEFFEDQEQEESDEPSFQVRPEPTNTLKLNETDIKFINDAKRNLDLRPMLADWMMEKGGKNYDDFGQAMLLSIEKDRLNRNPEDYNYERLNTVSDRLRDLLAEHDEEWLWPWIVDDWRGNYANIYAEFREGMLSVTASPQLIRRTLQQIPAERALQFVDSIILTGGDAYETYRLFGYEYSDDPRLLRVESPSWIKQISSLNLNGISTLQHHAEEILHAIGRYGENLYNLNLSETRIGSYESENALQYLANSQNFDNLMRLNLSNNNLSIQSFLDLITSPGLQNIRELNLRGNQGARHFETELRERFGDAVIF